MKGVFEGTGFIAFDLDEDPQAALKEEMGDFDEADLHKVFAQSHGKYIETVTIASISRHIGRKLQAQTKTVQVSINHQPKAPPLHQDLNKKLLNINTSHYCSYNQ